MKNNVQSFETDTLKLRMDVRHGNYKTCVNIIGFSFVDFLSFTKRVITLAL